MSTHGKLYLLPVPIADGPLSRSIPEYNTEVIRGLRYFIAEDARTARSFLKKFSYPEISAAEISILNEHSVKEDLSVLLSPLLSGHDVGLMSDAGCPGVADPGASVVHLAHLKGITVEPMVGPSSVLLAVMSSGFTGQNFAFAGYLPVDKTERARRIREMEQICIRQEQAQFFIETPYRNEALFDSLLTVLHRDTLLFVGADLLGAGQFLKTNTIGGWRSVPRPNFHKIPALFGIYRES